ncbi:gephyrin-like molybdotransferase receptor GlpR [Kitasatospora sp. NBC_01539]|uniref:divisome protein SepX/GlpR n=1 Tax=Kitasatospora sp. NBC_01539 TaxID=2903577 RepID=UPI0038603330
MSSSGLIYAVIVGAWAAYLVPMWLRRQDELNESRPTERFSTAIRLLAGRSALERRVSKSLADDTTDGEPAADAVSGTPGDAPAPGDASPAGAPGPTAPAAPAPERLRQPAPAAAERDAAARDTAARDADAPAHPDDRHQPRSAPERPTPERRARLLARRRRMVTALFFAFALGAVVAAVAGIAFIWVPTVPAALLTLYIGHLRRLERQRYEVKLDRVRAAQAAERLRARERDRRAPAATDPERPAAPHDAAHAAHAADRPARTHLRLAATGPAPAEARGEARGEVRASGPAAAAASALAETTDHEEWVDGMRERGPAGADSWEPVPVPLPTYVTAPVAPRVTRGLDLAGPGVRDSGRPAESRRTPLFDQYAESAPPGAAASAADLASRPRAANE